MYFIHLSDALALRTLGFVILNVMLPLISITLLSIMYYYNELLLFRQKRPVFTLFYIIKSIFFYSKLCNNFNCGLLGIIFFYLIAYNRFIYNGPTTVQHRTTGPTLKQHRVNMCCLHSPALDPSSPPESSPVLLEDVSLSPSMLNSVPVAV